MTTTQFEKYLEDVLNTELPADDLVAIRNIIAQSKRLSAAYTMALIAENITQDCSVLQMLFAAVFEAGKRAGTEAAAAAMFEGK
jgi:hypothetical protein